MSSEPKVLNVLFVCLGNICRSPTAEAVFADRVNAAGLGKRFRIDSAGTLSAHAGEMADARMRKHAHARGYDLQSRSRKVTDEDFINFDTIIAMDLQNMQDLKDRAPDQVASRKISLFLDAAPHLHVREVPDPYYGGSAGFENVLDLIEAASDALLQKLTDEHHI